MLTDLEAELTDRQSTNLLGEETLLKELLAIITKEKSFLINIYGEKGTGKSALFNYLQQTDKLTVPFKRLHTTETNEVLLDLDEEAIILLDDADYYYSKHQFKSIVTKSFSQHANLKLIITSKDKFFLEAIPGINQFQFEIGNRFFDADDFKEALTNTSLKDIVKENTLPDFIVKNLFLFTTYCRNFNYVREVLEAVTRQLESNQVITPQDFIYTLTKSELFTRIKQDMVIDTKNVENSDYLFFIRPKDKIEKLRDLILKYYPEEYVLVEVMKNQMDTSFVEHNFHQDIPYEDKVLNICLTLDPIELLVNILGPRDIIIELNQNKIAESVFTYSIEDKAKLLLKKMGMNIIEKPKGLDYFIERFQRNKRQLEKDIYNKTNKEYMIGLGISCYQEMEHIFYEMLNFYTTYLFGSMSRFFDLYNQENPSNKIFEKRITFGQYIGLFAYISKMVTAERYQIKMMNLNLQTILPNKVIRQLEKISAIRAFFSHSQKVQNMEVPYHTYRNRTIQLFEYVIEMTLHLKELNVFPEIIKIKEIKFDEFGRKLFTATDWTNNEIRFSLSDSLKDIDIYSHYYILRNKQKFMINPILTPRMVEVTNQKFSGSHYEKSSHTQLKQGSTLIQETTVAENSKILDIGCGNGRTTIELFNKNPQVTIDAFDLSDSMVQKAIQNRDKQGIPKEKVNFFVMNAIDLNEAEKYDLIFSNAALHWVTDAEAMYQRIYNSLKPGGKIAIHQGGYGSYQGLHQLVQKAIDILDLEMYYQNWTYPIYYPEKDSYIDLLASIGFEHINVKSVETDGSEFPNLPENFSNAGMIPYFAPLPDDKLRKKLKREFLKLCSTEKVNKYSHRLYAFATKGK